MKISIITAISLIYSGILYGQYFLKEYKDIRLGMSREELQATRPNAEPFGFEEETSDLLVEKSVDEVKGTVMYGFDEDTLVSFMMGSEFENLEDARLLKEIFINYRDMKSYLLNLWVMELLSLTQIKHTIHFYPSPYLRTKETTTSLSLAIK